MSYTKIRSCLQDVLGQASWYEIATAVASLAFLTLRFHVSTLISTRHGFWCSFFILTLIPCRWASLRSSSIAQDIFSKETCSSPRCGTRSAHQRLTLLMCTLQMQNKRKLMCLQWSTTYHCRTIIRLHLFFLNLSLWPSKFSLNWILWKLLRECWKCWPPLLYAPTLGTIQPGVFDRVPRSWTYARK